LRSSASRFEEQKRLDRCVAVERPCSIASRVATTFQAEAPARKFGVNLLSDLRKADPRARGSRAEVPSARSCRTTTTSSRRSNTAVFHRRLVRVTNVPKGVRCPLRALDLLPHQRVVDRAVRADADHRRRGASYVSVPRGLPRRPCGTRNQLHAGGGRAHRAGQTRRFKYSTIQKLVSGRRRSKRRDLQLRHEAAARLPVAIRRSPGRRSRPAPRSRGSIRAAFSRATNSIGEVFYSVASDQFTGRQADTRPTKMIPPRQENTAARRSCRREISAGPRAEYVSRVGENHEGRRGRAELLGSGDSDAHRRQMRRAHLPVHRRAQQHRDHGARGVPRRRSVKDQIFYLRQRGPVGRRRGTR